MHIYLYILKIYITFTWAIICLVYLLLFLQKGNKKGKGKKAAKEKKEKPAAGKDGKKKETKSPVVSSNAPYHICGLILSL